MIYPGKEEEQTDQEEAAYGVQQDRDCHYNVSQREEHANEKVGREACGERKADKPLYRMERDVREADRVGSACVVFLLRNNGPGEPGLLTCLVIPSSPCLLSSNMPPRGTNERLDFTPILTHYLFLFTSVFAVVSFAF